MELPLFLKLKFIDFENFVILDQLFGKQETVVVSLHIYDGGNWKIVNVQKYVLFCMKCNRLYILTFSPVFQQQSCTAVPSPEFQTL